MQPKTIICEYQDNIGIVTLNRPDRMNALTMELVGELERFMNEVENNSAVKAIIITGGDKFFCAGADLKEQTQEGFKLQTFLKKLRLCFCAIESLGKPVIAAINGVAFGGGLELALACDLRIASDTAKLGSPEIKIGGIPGGGATQRLSRIVGLGRAKELILLGEPIDANEAYRIGLVNSVVTSATLMTEAKRIATTLAENYLPALMAAKHAINMSVNVNIDSGLDYEIQWLRILEASGVLKEAAHAFIEKRKATLK